MRWQSSIRDSRIRGGRDTHLGTYGDERMASAAYDLALVVLGQDPVNRPLSVYAAMRPRAPVITMLNALSWRIAGEAFPNRYSRDETAHLARHDPDDGP